MPVDRIVCSGGIADKNPFLMQVYADVTGCEMQLSRSSQSCALGSAIGAAVVAGLHPDYPAAQAAMTGVKAERFRPNPAAQATYNKLYALYRTLHDAFGGVTAQADLSGVMKALLALKQGV